MVRESQKQYAARHSMQKLPYFINSLLQRDVWINLSDYIVEEIYLAWETLFPCSRGFPK